MKKAFTLVLAMLLVMSMATTAFAASNVPAPVAGFGFNEDEGMTIVGGELASDAERGQVLTLNGGQARQLRHHRFRCLRQHRLDRRHDHRFLGQGC